MKFSNYLLKNQQDNYKNSFLIQFVINSVIATLVVVALLNMEDLVFFKEIKNFALDKIMYWHSDFEPKLRDGQKMQRMALITIDDKTYRDWGFPLITPRDKLKVLIEKSVQGGANVIAVDIELGWSGDGCVHAPDKPPACPPTRDSAADDELAAYLHELNERDSAPPIILVGMYRKPLQEFGLIDKTAFFEKQPSFLDEVLNTEKNVFWATAMFVVDEDRFWRRGQLAPLVCEQGHLTVVPSMPLLTALAELHSDNTSTSAVAAIRQLKTRLNDWAKQFSCDIKLEQQTIAEICRVYNNCPDLTVRLPQKNGVNDKTHLIDLAATDANDRIVYRFAPADQPNPTQRTVVDIDRATEVLTYGINAQNKTVLIGATHQDNQDRHPIPIRVLTDVDGIYLVANATDTLLRFGRLQTQSEQQKLIAFISLVVLMTLVFTVFNSFFAQILSFGLIFMPLFIWTFYQLHQGIVIELALYSLAIQVIQMLVKLVTILLLLKTNHQASANQAVSRKQHVLFCLF